MAYISKLQIGGTTYDIYDAEVRQIISSTMLFLGVTTATITDGATTPATYGGLPGITIPEGKTTTDPVQRGDVVIYDGAEFVWDGAKWSEFGDLSHFVISGDTDDVLGKDTTFTITHESATTGTGSSHRHTIPDATKGYLSTTSTKGYLSTTPQSATLASQVATGALQATSSGAGGGVITSLTTTPLSTQMAEVLTTSNDDTVDIAKAGTAVPVFNTVNATAQGGYRVLQSWSTGVAGTVTVGTAASLPDTVLTSLQTSNATATGRIAYTQGVVSTNKLATASFTPASTDTKVTVLT